MTSFLGSSYGVVYPSREKHRIRLQFRSYGQMRQDGFTWLLWMKHKVLIKCIPEVTSGVNARNLLADRECGYNLETWAPRQDSGL
jgi:hypothetical protein